MLAAAFTGVALVAYLGRAQIGAALPVIAVVLPTLLLTGQQRCKRLPHREAPRCEHFRHTGFLDFDVCVGHAQPCLALVEEVVAAIGEDNCFAVFSRCGRDLL